LQDHLFFTVGEARFGRLLVDHEMNASLFGHFFYLHGIICITKTIKK